jgi:putative salt-induced outer membrane protein YdiY
MLTILIQTALMLPQGAAGTPATTIETELPEINFFAEVDVQDPETSAWSGTADAGMTLISGNNESSNGSANFTAAWAEGLDAFDFGAHYAGTRTTNKVTNDASTTSRLYLYEAGYDRFFTEAKDFYGYAKASSREDIPNGLQSRNDIGVGVGYNFFLYENAAVKVEGGSSYVAENKVGTAADSSAVGRAAYTFETPIMETINFDGAGEYLKGGDIETYTQDFGVNWNFEESWYLRASYNIAWDGNPSAGFSSTDRRFNLVVGTSF